jgi:hypothetical protein
MARQEQRGVRQAVTGIRRVPRNAALEATRRQSVPESPAAAVDTSPRPATPISTRPLTAAPSGPARRTLAAATGLHPASPGPAKTTGSLRSLGPPAATQPAAQPSTRRQDALPGGGEAPLPDAAANAAIGPAAPERPTFALPTTTGADVLALMPDADDRRLAARAAPHAQAVFIRGSRKAPRRAATVVPRRIGPRSFVAQFIIAMVSVMILFSVLALVSPLGRSGIFAGTFQAYANSAPWIPTPTPTPKPKPAYVPPPGANPGQQAIINDIVAVFGSYAQGAINVARCESDFDPNARNPYAIGSSHAEGVFQILYPSTWDGTSYSGYSPYNYDANIHAAYQIFSRDGHTWREWACQP